MQIKKFYEKNKITINGVIMWFLPWLFLFLSYPKSLYLSREFYIELLNIDLIFMIISFLIIFSFSILLQYLKKTSSKLYKPLLWIGVIIYLFIVIQLLFWINFLSGIKDI